mgnify:CR=1 FL=1
MLRRRPLGLLRANAPAASSATRRSRPAPACSNSSSKRWYLYRHPDGGRADRRPRLCPALDRRTRARRARGVAAGRRGRRRHRRRPASAPVNPSGRLPISMPRSGPGAVYYGHKSGGGRSQMLGDYSDGPTSAASTRSATACRTRASTYSDLDDRTARAPRRADASGSRSPVRSPTTGERDRRGGRVQLYVRDPVASVTRPVKQLVGFAPRRARAGRIAPRDAFPPRSEPARLLRRRRCGLIVEPGDDRRSWSARSSADIRAAKAASRSSGEVRDLTQGEIVRDPGRRRLTRRKCPGSAFAGERRDLSVPARGPPRCQAAAAHRARPSRLRLSRPAPRSGPPARAGEERDS